MTDRVDIQNYLRKYATHRLSCCHVIGISRVDYCMDCIILKEMPNDRLKILVFGERNRKGCDSKKQIRYVDKFRVEPKKIKTKPQSLASFLVNGKDDEIVTVHRK